jgi:hypothetical protein
MYDTTTVLQGNTPVEGTGLWTIVSGTDGTIDNPSNPTSAFHGRENHSYTLRWTISNEYCSSYDEVMISLKPEIPEEGLVAYYPFNGDANDESGNGNHGTLHEVLLILDRFGNSNCAYSFNGIDAYIDVESTGIPNNPAVMTQCAWIKIPAGAFQNEEKVILTRRHLDDGTDWSTLMISEGKAVLSLDDRGYKHDAISNSNVNDGIWHFLVGINDYGKYTIYVDGQLQGRIVDNHLMDGSILNLHIGHHGAWNNWWDGTLDDIRIYDRALSEAEIVTLYHEGGWAINATVISTIENQQICKNDSTSFEVKADGILPLYYQWQKDGAHIIGATDSVLTILQVQPEDAGEYRCIATNEYGADTSNTALLTVEFAVPTYILGDTTVTLFQVATYSVDACAGHSYEFMVEGCIKVDGTDNSITVHWNTAGMGYVKLIEMSELGCYADANTLEVNIGYSGIDDQEIQNLMVYPNPSTGTTTFHYALAEPSQVTLQIYNLYGQQVGILNNENQQKGNHQFSWNTEGLPSGIYFYRLSTGKQSYTGKMTVAR